MSTWITAAEFAKRMGCSRSNVTQAIATGRIQPKYVRRDGTRVRVATACIADWEATSNRHQQRGLLPMAWGGSTEITEKELDLAPSWDQVAELANASLDCSAWGAPPWSGDQWATLAVVLELATSGDG